LSHREWGDATPTLAVLAETTNPAQGRLRGRTDAPLVRDGRDRFYTASSERGRLSVPFPAEGWPMRVRVGRQLATVGGLVTTHAVLAPDRAIVFETIPACSDVLARGVGAYLRPPP
jgi:hypothetical protein